MGAPPQTPNVYQVVGKGIDALVALRPSAAPFVENGVYGDIFAGWRAQLKLLKRRLVDECKSTQLTLAEGQALLELAQSEFGAVLDTTTQKAAGTAYLSRPTFAAGGGVIPAKTRFRLEANATASPQVQAATYESVEPVYVGPTDLTTQVRVVATQAGASANIPKIIGKTAVLKISDTLFDPTLAPTLGEAAGGSSGLLDGDVRALSTALYTGQYAPTDGAILAGALSATGVRHAALLTDNIYGQSVVFAADESWGFGQQFAATTLQAIKNNWLGFGARAVVRQVSNRLVSVTANVQVSSAQYLADSLDIREAVRAALRNYLDNRPDFYWFDSNVMRGVVAQADTRILTCLSLTVSDVGSGLALVPVKLTAQSSFAQHYYLADNGVNLTIGLPS